MDILDKLIAEAIAKKAKPEVAAPFVPSDEKLEEAFVAIAKCGYEPDRDPAATKNLAIWLAALRAKRTTRGLLLYGKAGAGKTYFVQKVCRVRPRPAAWFVAVRQEKGWGEAFDEICYGIFRDSNVSAGPIDICIDDLGQEPISNTYGNREEIFEQVIAQRYVQWQGNGCKTYITTNMTLMGIQDRYGARIMDRLAEMCHWVEFTGASARSEGEA